MSKTEYAYGLLTLITNEKKRSLEIRLFLLRFRESREKRKKSVSIFSLVQ